MIADDPFDEGVPRNGRGQPLITPAKRDGTPNLTGKPVPYTRASVYAKALDDGAGLTRWKVRHAAVGIAGNPDLAALVAAMGRDLNAYSDDDKRALDAIIERAHDRSGGNVKADHGTAVHSMTEPDRDPFALDDGMARDVQAYAALLAQMGVEVTATETLVVVDETKVAGTFDHTYRLSVDLTFEPTPGKPVTLPAGTVVVVDKKTGRLSLLPHAIQLATYARGKVYDHRTGERSSMDASPQWGLVVHVPRGEGVARAYVIDLHAGWKAAKLAAEVRAARSTEQKLGTLVAEATAPDTDGTPPAAPAIEAAPVAEVVVEAPVEGKLERAEPAVEAEVVPPAGVDEFGDPTPDDTLTTADAVANLARAGMQPTDALLAQIAEADTAETCRVLWSTNRAAWQDSHTDAVKRRLAELARAAA